MEPDFAGFTKAVLEETIFDDYRDLEAYDVFELAKKFRVIKSEPYDPKIHGEETDCEMNPGDEWWVPAFTRK